MMNKLWVMTIFLFVSPFSIADDKVSIRFAKTISSCISSDLLWQSLRVAMQDSQQSWLWPKKRSKVLGEGLRNGAEISVTYFSLFSSPTYFYELSEVENGKKFVYTAIAGKHPFEGGARIWLEQDDDKNLLHWQGEYFTSSTDWLARRFFDNYSRHFFRDLQNNVKQQEESICR